MDITIHQEWDFTQIHINGVLHIELPKLSIAVETWMDVTDGFTKFMIQFVNAETGKVIILCEYNTREKWEAIIKLWQNRNRSAEKLKRRKNN